MTQEVASQASNGDKLIGLRLADGDRERLIGLRPPGRMIARLEIYRAAASRQDGGAPVSNQKLLDQLLRLGLASAGIKLRTKPLAVRLEKFREVISRRLGGRAVSTQSLLEELLTMGLDAAGVRP